MFILFYVYDHLSTVFVLFFAIFVVPFLVILVELKKCTKKCENGLVAGFLCEYFQQCKIDNIE